jgi:hypothetical protein
MKKRHCSLCKHFRFGRMNRHCEAGESVTVPEANYPNVWFKYCGKFENLGLKK